MSISKYLGVRSSKDGRVMDKIRVMYITVGVRMGGAVQSLLDMVTANQDIIEPTIIMPMNGPLEDYLHKHDIRYFIVPFEAGYGKQGTDSKKKQDDNFVNNYSAALQLQRIIAEGNIQLIHTNTSVTNVGAFAALLSDVPHIWHIREFVREDLGCEFWDAELKKKLFSCTEKYIAISESIRQKYSQEYGIDMEKLYNGIGIDRFIEDINEKDDNCNFLLAGDIIPEKGQFDAIKAMEVLLSSGERSSNLYLVGAGDYKYIWLLKQYVKKHNLQEAVHFLGYRESLKNLRKKCRFSLTASKMEALGRITVEAMLAGNIVVGADTGGTAEIIGDDLSRGYLYRQGDYKDLARVMALALDNADHNKTILDRAQKYAIENFNPQKYILRMVEIYREVLSDRSDARNNKKKRLLLELEERYTDLCAGSKSSNVIGYRRNKMPAAFRETRRWLTMKQAGLSIEDVLIKKGISSIAIYGMGYLGCSLYDELEGGGVRIEYIMDKGMEDTANAIRLVSMEEELPEADAVVVTVLSEIQNLCEQLRKKCSYKIVSIVEILDWCEDSMIGLE